MRKYISWILLTSATLGTVAGSVFPDRPTSAEKDKTIDDLVRDLGSDSYAVRETATQRLLALRRPPRALKRAAESTDLEVVRRAKRILDTLARRRLTGDAMAIQADARAGRVDLLAERVARWTGADDDPACWQPVFDVAARLRQIDPQWFRPYEQHVRGMSLWYPFQSFPRFLKHYRPNVLPRGAPTHDLRPLRANVPYPGTLLARGESVSADGLSRCVFAASGPLRLRLTMNAIGLTAAGAKTTQAEIAVIVCDGDFEGEDGLIASVVVTRGDFRCPGHLDACVAFVGGDVVLPPYCKIDGSRIRCGGRVVGRSPKHSIRDSQIEENHPAPLPGVSFFDPLKLGVVVAPDRHGVRVTRVVDGTPLAKAGLRRDDLVLEMDEAPVRTPAEFRRILRGCLVEGDATLRVRRDGKAFEIHVPFDD